MEPASNIRDVHDGETVSEQTTLLRQESSSHGTFPREDTLWDEDTDEDIEANEFDNMLAKSESVTTGLGIEPNSQETAMLRGPRKYPSLTRSFSRNLSRTSSRRKSFASTNRSIQDGIMGEDLNEPQSPFRGVSSTRFWLIFSGILVTYFVACFDSTIMVSSHPVITSYFESSNSASWLSTAFLLTSTSFQPLFGRLSDTIGRKPPYVFAMTVFLISTIWCGLAQSMLSFIIARAVCGLGAGGMMTMGSIITSDLVPIEIRGAYQSYINILFGVGSALGAALGGTICDHLGWRWIFGIQIPVLVAHACIAIFTVPADLGLENGAKKKTLWEAMKVFDFKGSILLTISVAFLILGFNLGGNVYPWTHPFVLTSLIIFVIGSPLFIYVESYVELPIMPLNIITKDPRRSIILGNHITAIIANAVIFNIPLYFQAVLLESATSSGLRLIVPSVASSTVGTATGFLITWSKQLKPPLVAGVILLLVGTVALSCMRRGLPDWTYLLLLVPQSMGNGFIFPASFMSVLAVSEQSEQAVVTSTLILWRSMGTVLGVATSSLVLQNALYYYLNEFVTGPGRDYVIEEVRKSVRAIPGLDPIHREQVVDAYAASLRATFIMAAILSVVNVVITCRLKLPKLGERK